MALTHYLILSQLLFCIISYTESVDPTAQYCNQDTKINDTKITSNIDTLLKKLVSATIRNSFSAISSGYDTHQVYGLAQCRGDVSKQECSTCVQNASKEIKKLCPNEGDARIWYDYCFLRYNTKKFFGEVSTYPGTLYQSTVDVTNTDVFNKELGKLYNKIRKQAIKPANKGLGKGKSEKLSTFSTLYALVQCTRDLSQLGCAQCLAEAASNFEGFCKNKRGCRVLYSSCYVRYELYPFYFPLGKLETADSFSAKYQSTIVTKI